VKQSGVSGVYRDMRYLHQVLALGGVVCSVACGPDVDLTRALKVENVSTGWYEATVAGNDVAQIKLVPAVSFTLKNLSDHRLGVLQVNAVFKRIDQDHEWASGFLTAAGSDGLAPGAVTNTLFVPSPRGYTGSESRFDLLKNSQFVDAKVQVFAKYAATKWVPVGEYAIARQLIDQRWFGGN
jgi:hypothetical protein